MPTTDSCQCRDIQHLMQGASHFKQRFYSQDPELMRQLVEQGQSPVTLVISCSDSRVDPALLTNAKPGELFTVRNVSNIVPPYGPSANFHGTSSAIEFAVRDLQVPNIIVLGHGRCGGIQALLSTLSGNDMQRDFIADWVSIAMDACRQFVGDPDNPGSQKEISIDLLREHQDLVERASVQGSLRNLMTYPWLRARVDAGNLQLHGWWFDLESGDLWTTTPESPTLLLPVI
ncbi:carbonic anhydrase [Mesopusillimonas faecipullorum]|nr:carbonic anhydrase [Mesopusillimonas faecipullorum]